MSTHRADYVGQRFGRLVVVAMTFDGRYSHCVVRCDCGTQKEVWASSLKKGTTVSCGCWCRERVTKQNLRHGNGGVRSAEYETWLSMHQRCYNSAHKSFPDYGGRGIGICDRWRFGENGKHPFACFIEDMGKRPSLKHSIDRYPDNDGNYEPGNCRWATAREQALNRRSSRNIKRRELARHHISNFTRSHPGVISNECTSR